MQLGRAVGAGVAHHLGPEAVVQRVGGGRADAARRRHARDDEGVDPGRVQRRGERGAEERARVLLGDHRLARGGLQHELAPAAVGVLGEGGERGHLAHEQAAVGEAAGVAHDRPHAPGGRAPAPRPPAPRWRRRRARGRAAGTGRPPRCRRGRGRRRPRAGAPPHPTRPENAVPCGPVIAPHPLTRPAPDRRRGRTGPSPRRPAPDRREGGRGGAPAVRRRTDGRGGRGGAPAARRRTDERGGRGGAPRRPARGRPQWAERAPRAPACGGGVPSAGARAAPASRPLRPLGCGQAGLRLAALQQLLERRTHVEHRQLRGTGRPQLGPQRFRRRGVDAASPTTTP